MRIVITGGHPSPALAVIDEINLNKQDWEVYFVGTKYPLTNDKAVSFEYKEITTRGIPFVELTTGKLDRTNKIKLFFSLFKVICGYLRSLIILYNLKPDLILSFGGYIAVPVVYAAKTLGIRVVTHEQTFEMGFANRLIAKVADLVLLSWTDTKKVRSEWKTVVTGLPLRKAVIEAKANEVEPEQPVLLVIGGSQGAHYINELVVDMLDSLLNKYKVVHQVGDSSVYGDFEALMLKKQKLETQKQNRYELYKHISTGKLGKYLALAKLVLSRAGANTMAELLYLEKKAVLIPLLESVNPEQLVNAKYYAGTKLGSYLKQEDANVNSLENELARVMKVSRNVQDSDRKIFRELKNAAGKIVYEIETLING